MGKIKNLVYVLTALWSIAFFDGLFEWHLAERFYTVIGLIVIVTLIWLNILVSKK